jgi:hypothetical protein
MPVTIALLCLGVPISAQRAPAPAASEDPFARRSWNLELEVHGSLEAWNYNISHEELAGLSAGFSYGLRNGLLFTVSWPLTYVSQRGVDAFMMGGTFGVRGRIYNRPRWSLFLAGEVGVSDADTFVPPRGTRFNYLAIGTAGATIRMSRTVHMLCGLQVTHISNGGFAGRDRNPDIEAIGPKLGVLVGF